MINPGAIVTASLVKKKDRIADRFDYVSQQYKRFAGGEYLGFNNAVYVYIPLSIYLKRNYKHVKCL